LPAGSAPAVPALLEPPPAAEVWAGPKAPEPVAPAKPVAEDAPAVSVRAEASPPPALPEKPPAIPATPALRVAPPEEAAVEAPPADEASVRCPVRSPRRAGAGPGRAPGSGPTSPRYPARPTFGPPIPGRGGQTSTLTPQILEW